MNIIWNDNINPPYSGTLDLYDPQGIGDASVAVIYGVNEHIDRECELKVISNEGDAFDIMVVRQEGKREIIRTSDGETVRLKGLGSVNVLK